MTTITIITTSILAALVIYKVIDIALNHLAREDFADIKYEYWEAIAEKH